LIENYTDDKLILAQKNQGLAVILIKGIKACEGES
jgi:hypothetical protein